MPSGPPTAALATFLAVTIFQRLGELAVSVRTRRLLLARGAREYGAGHFWVFVVLHTLYPLALIYEVMGGGARPPSWWPAALTLWIAAQALRWWAVASLGDRWNVRVLVIPGLPLVRTGAYAFVRHPNYVAVVVDMVAGPLIFGAWWTAIGATVLNAIALGIRLRVENRALLESTRG